jgi:hypothetical protein
MRLGKLLDLLVASVVAVPALPAHADGDTVAPHSAFATPNGAIVLRSPILDGKVEGDSTDDLAIQGVLVRYCNTLFCQYRFEQNAAPQQTQHWTFDVPPDGTWQVNVRALDAAGNMEQPGPEITISVLPVELPELPPLPLPEVPPLAPLPRLDQLPLPH